MVTVEAGIDYGDNDYGSGNEHYYCMVIMLVILMMVVVVIVMVVVTLTLVTAKVAVMVDGETGL
jgi:uncharacterized membrane protein